MGKFLFSYHGGSAPATPEAREAVMGAWGAWLGSLGEAVVDAGDPVGRARTVAATGNVSDTATPVAGYSIVNAGSIDDAVALARGCPVLAAGGAVEVGELLDMM